MTVLQTPSARPAGFFDPGTGELTVRTMLALVALCFTATILSVLFIDRAVADYAHSHLRVNGKETAFFKALTDIPDPIPVLAGLVTAWFSVGLLFGIRPGPLGRVALQIALAVLVAVTIKEQLKVLTGRTWPETWTNNNPSWIKNRVFGFFPMTSLFGEKVGRAYMAFPSGHMTIIAVAMTSLALNAGKRWVWWVAAVPVVLVAIGMVGCNYHWVSDLIFGAFLGAGVALAAYRLARRVEGGPRLN